MKPWHWTLALLGALGGAAALFAVSRREPPQPSHPDAGFVVIAPEKQRPPESPFVLAATANEELARVQPLRNALLVGQRWLMAVAAGEEVRLEPRLSVREPWAARAIDGAWPDAVFAIGSPGNREGPIWRIARLGKDGWSEKLREDYRACVDLTLWRDDSALVFESAGHKAIADKPPFDWPRFGAPRFVAEGSTKGAPPPAPAGWCVQSMVAAGQDVYVVAEACEGNENAGIEPHMLRFRAGASRWEKMATPSGARCAGASATPADVGHAGLAITAVIKRACKPGQNDDFPVRLAGDAWVIDDEDATAVAQAADGAPVVVNGGRVRRREPSGEWRDMPLPEGFTPELVWSADQGPLWVWARHASRKYGLFRTGRPADPVALPSSEAWMQIVDDASQSPAAGSGCSTIVLDTAPLDAPDDYGYPDVTRAMKGKPELLPNMKESTDGNSHFEELRIRGRRQLVIRTAFIQDEALARKLARAMPGKKIAVECRLAEHVRFLEMDFDAGTMTRR